MSDSKKRELTSTQHETLDSSDAALATELEAMRAMLMRAVAALRQHRGAEGRAIAARASNSLANIVAARRA